MFWLVIPDTAGKAWLQAFYGLQYGQKINKKNKKKVLILQEQQNFVGIPEGSRSAME